MICLIISGISSALSGPFIYPIVWASIMSFPRLGLRCPLVKEWCDETFQLVFWATVSLLNRRGEFQQRGTNASCNESLTVLPLIFLLFTTVCPGRREITEPFSKKVPSWTSSFALAGSLFPVLFTHVSVFHLRKLSQAH